MGRHEQHAAKRGQNTARTMEATHCMSRTRFSGDTAFFNLYDEEDAVWGTRPASLAGAAGADLAAHRGAVRRHRSHGTDCRRSCAADGGTAGGCPEAHRHAVTCRAGYRRAQDLSGQHSTADRALGAPFRDCVIKATLGGRAGTVLGHWWPHVVPVFRAWGLDWWKSGTRHTKWTPPEGATVSPGRYTNNWARLRRAQLWTSL